jgi:dTDP-4-amino-4,6-dideoxygalactose transaminase
MGDAGCFSFYFTKNLGAYGEGGIITTSDAGIAEKCRMIRDHGQSAKYHHAVVGFNGRLDEVQAAVLNIKLRHLDGWLEQRRSLAEAYISGLSGDYVLPREMPWARHVYHLFVIRTPLREKLREWLGEKGVSAGMHYPIPVHRQEAWRKYGGRELALPVTEKITGEILSLPMYPELTRPEVDYVCDCINQFSGSPLAVEAEK